MAGPPPVASRQLEFAAGAWFEPYAFNAQSSLRGWNFLAVTLSVPVIAWGICTDLPPAVSGFTNWTIIALNGVVGVAVLMTVFNKILRTLRSYEASILASSTVVFTVLLAYPILGERPDGYQIAGIALLLVGVVLAQLRSGFRGPRV